MKNKKKKDAYSIAEQNIKILKSGKVKIKKGQKISLTPYISDSVANIVCSRLDAIIDTSRVDIDTSACKFDTDLIMNTIKRSVEMLTKLDKGITYTITHIINKKDAIKIFDFMNDSIVGTLLRSSTLASIFKKIQYDWSELNVGDKSSFTNILFVPNILVFLDPDTGKIIKTPYKVNLLLIVEPSQKYQKEIPLEKATDEEAITRMISDVFTAAIKCGAKNLVVAPYCHKLLLNDPYNTAGVWCDHISTQDTISNLSSVNFAINNEELYIIFMKRKSTGLNSDLTV